MIPRFAIQAVTIGADTYEAEGKLLQVRWFGLVFEFAVARVTRRLDR